MMIEVVSRQRHRRMDAERWRVFAAQALQAIGRGGEEVTIAFVSDRRIRELNRLFRGVDSTTDVLSFPADRDEFTPAAERSLGEIGISVARAEEQAKENGLELDTEIAQLILHGLLHLCGYDHETDNGEMNRLELRLRRHLGI
jgi:probable rRNA maturation factor